MDNSIIIQRWLHIYDEYSKYSFNKKVRYVLDIYTFGDFFDFDLKEENFANLFVKSRNTNSELAYIEDDFIIKISLGPMDRYPKIRTDLCENFPNDSKIKEFLDNNREHIKKEDFFHIKLEISHVFLDPVFEKRKWGKLDKGGYISSFYTSDRIHPEFHINIPKGLSFDLNSLLVKVYFNNLEEDTEENYREFSICNKLVDCYEDSNNNKCVFTLNNKKYDDILLNKNYKGLFLEYEVRTSKKYYLVFLFGLLLLLLCFASLFEDALTVAFVALISFVVLYLSLEREGYLIPFKKYIMYFIIISGFLLAIKLSILIVSIILLL